LLGEKNIIRVAATGRNLKKLKEVIQPETTFDFIVYSSGAGIFDWNKQKEIFHQNITQNSSYKLLKFFTGRNISFHAFFPAPENHNHWYFRGDNPCEEFDRYFDFNKAFSYSLNVKELPKSELCQFLVIIKENTFHFKQVKKEIESVCDQIRVIRTSSPISEKYIWIEIFHQSVSKGNGVKHLCDLLGIEQNQTIGIGNDFNDLDLLSFTKHSYLTQNAPIEIQEHYPQIPSNEQDAFSFVVEKLIT
jgi:hypothetical protein